MSDTPHVGVVEDARFKLLSGKTVRSYRLTALPKQGAQAPEAMEIDLAKHEGSALLVTGHPDGLWIYEAEVVDKGGPLLAAVVGKVFGKKTGKSS